MKQNWKIIAENGYVFIVHIPCKDKASWSLLFPECPTCGAIAPKGMREKRTLLTFAIYDLGLAPE
jgi:hypothetical protein